MTSLRVIILVSTLFMAGCVAPAPDRPLASPSDRDGTPSSTPQAKPAIATFADPKNASTTPQEPLEVVRFDAHIDFIVFPFLYKGNSQSTQDLQYTTTFPKTYKHAVLEMVWTPKLQTQSVLSLMLHEPGSVSQMIGGVDGTSPLRLHIDADVAKPGKKYDLVVFVPMDGRTPVVLDQDAKLYASFFAGEPPNGYTAVPR